MKRNPAISFILLLFASSSLSQTAPYIEWQKNLGSSSDDIASCVRQTSDGGYIAAGYSGKNNGDVISTHGELDYWIVKLNSSGSIEWQKSFGGSSIDIATDIQRTRDGGYVVAGYSYSNNGNVSGNHGDADYWIVKLTSTGTILWQKTLGGSKADLANSVQQTTDGGYILAGTTLSKDGDVTGNHGSGPHGWGDYWIVKLNNTGNIIWQKNLGGPSDDFAYNIQQTADGGYIVSGSSSSGNGNVIGNHGDLDFWIVKLDNNGNIMWQKSLGGSGQELVGSVIHKMQTLDGGYIIAGASSSVDGDVTENHGEDDYWIVKLDNSGNIVWQKSFGGSSNEQAIAVQQTKDGGYIVAGYSNSLNGNVTGNHGDDDFWIVKLKNTGDMEWQKSLGGTIDEQAFSIQQTKDSSYIVAGYSRSVDGDLTGNHGGADWWILKLSKGCSNPITVSATTGIIECNGQTTQVKVTASGGTLPYSGVGIFTAGAGVHTYTVTDSLKCIGTKQIIITQPKVLIVTATPEKILCVGGTTSVNISASGGTTPYNGTGTFTVKAGVHNYTVTDAHGCSKSVSVSIPDGAQTIPGKPPKINGSLAADASGLCGGGSFKYSITPAVSSPSYTWTPPAGCSIASISSDLKNITLKVPVNFNSGILAVTANNVCGSSAPQTRPLSALPAKPSAIAGPGTVKPKAKGLVYSVNATPGLIYKWTFPAGVTVVSGQQSAIITVNWGSVPGQIIVSGKNECGSSSTSILNIKVSTLLATNENSPALLETIHQKITLIVTPNPAKQSAVVNFEAIEPSRYTIQVTNVIGKQIQTYKGIAKIGKNEVNINLDNYAKGSYIITFIDGENRRGSQILVKE